MEEKRCTYYDNGFCSKGLKGITKCELEGCVAHIIKPIKKFSEMSVGDDVFVVYNINWNKGKKGAVGYPEEYTIETGKIDKNNINVPKTVSIGDHHHRGIETIYESDIEIIFRDLTYGRSYSDYSDKNGEICISRPFLKYGPWITVFTEKENAVEYIKKICGNQIKELDGKIKTYQERKELLEKSIKNCQNI
jgi:hypothetical protein